MPRTKQRSLLGRIAAAIAGALSLFVADSERPSAASSPGAGTDAEPAAPAYWEGVASDPDDYENSVENLDTVEDDELSD